MDGGGKMHKKPMRGHIRERRKRIARDAKKMAQELKQFYGNPSSKAGYSPEERKASGTKKRESMKMVFTTILPSPYLLLLVVLK